MTALLVEERPSAAAAAAVPAPKSGASGPRVRYAPGLDGLRAISVVAVILYHCGVPFWAGGFLGVEVFFVISGYLITSLLIAERRNTGHIDMKRFWVRRARRLLPALFAVLGTVSLYSAIFLREDLARLRGDLIAALTYVTNWWLIFGNQSYFDTIGAPPLLKHLWSLAIEEQFYLLWPFIFAGLMFLTHGKRNRMLAILGGSALASALLMWILASPDHPDRVYMGTDTRASSLLLGAMLAFLWPSWRLTKRIKPAAATTLDALGAAAIVMLLVCFHTLDQFSTFLYPFGFLLTSLASMVAIAVVVHPGSRLVRPIVGSAPMRWVGLRSYGLYLWNWPIVAITDVQRGFTMSGPGLLILRIVATVGCAELSFRFIEQPIRTGSWKSRLAALRTRVRSLDGQHAQRVRYATMGAAMLALGVTLFTVASLVTATSGQSKFERDVLNGRSEIAAQSNVTTTVATADSVPGGVATTTPPPPPPPRVTAIGDSVMLGAADAILRDVPDVYVNAVKSRQFGEIFDILAALKAQNKVGQVVVIHLGTNGRITEESFVKLMDQLKDRQQVIVLTDRVPRPWEEGNNAILRGITPRYTNAVLLDWQAEGDQHGDLFYTDNIHLRQPDGANFYAKLISQKIAPPPPPPTTTTAAPPTTAKKKR